MAGTMSAFPYFLILLTLNVVHLVRGQSGTTPGIEGKFKERCSSFQKQNPAPFENNPKNCSLLWELFLKSFANKSSCAISPENYREFLLEANHTASIKDQAMFWSLTSPFVYNFTASQPGKYVTVLDLLSGYILDPLTWCWNSSKNDLDYERCPSWRNCPLEYEAVRSFFKANSAMFARLATGQVFVMLNGSTDGAYTNRSLFYTVEVPTMSRPPTTSMQVILVHNLGGPIRENCYNGTLVQLKSHFESKSIALKCTEDPPEVKSLQCRLYPEYYANYCSTNGAPASRPTVASIVIYQSFTIVVLFLVKLIG